MIDLLGKMYIWELTCWSDHERDWQKNMMFCRERVSELWDPKA